MNEKFEAVIGLEVHAQLLTDTKIFCGCSTKFGNEPNSNVCPICLGHPGVLPVLNKKVVEFALLMGVATKSTINTNSIFARKNYFYPDLPKGYQISQYEKPICEFGSIEIEKKDGTKKNIGITRIHMEEDAGKSIHDRGETTSIDVNRCGVPLLEIVSEPDMHSAEEAYLYLAKIKQLVQYLEICDGNMEEGSLRCDANISVRPFGQKEFGTKAEIKNMNSFRNVERAINYEIKRQIELIEDGGKVIQQTLLWDADANEAHPMRSKEEAHDYRYFPDPDLVPIDINVEWFDEIKAKVPELPDAKRERFISGFHLPLYDAEVLTQTKELANYFEQVTNVTNDYKAASNWVMVEVLKVLNEQKINVENFAVTPQNLGGLINLIQQGTISGKIAKDVFAEMLETKQTAEAIVKEKNLVQISDTSEIEKIIQQIFDANENQVKEFLEGKEKVFGFFVGQTMKATKGKANPQVVNDLLKKIFESLKQ
ncbi:MAG: Asp-tRNA(Asn)/Glu-tRNA(Gln) amidotransferase subunit GatB [Ignavibacteriaceae bacterium]|jgi:aspartyl-tRNA(Asn)/glutamyl-tRNA(Gln) amidotransferase subunit B|nr:Asp-tRNA(Asn)/Glu-tRNA(Gln) amidotransferase subunit GatB [Ignavibacteriaceae bacterium]